LVDREKNHDKRERFLRENAENFHGLREKSTETIKGRQQALDLGEVDLK